MVAEDDDFSFYVIESLLIPYDYKIIHAKNGEEAVNVFRSKEEISLVLMDIQMPVMVDSLQHKKYEKSIKEYP